MKEPFITEELGCACMIFALLAGIALIVWAIH